MRKGFLFGFICLMLMAGLALATEQRQEFPEIVISDLQGQAIQVKDFRGTVVVLNFWATWCGPCRMELPELQKLHKELGSKGFMVMAIAVDAPRELVKPFLDRLSITLPSGIIDRDTQAMLGIDRIPFTVLLDKEGRIVRVYAGYSAASVEDLRTQAKLLLAEKRKQGGK
jgi:thiol-disulfide isomerase/thioredoxin